MALLQEKSYHSNIWAGGERTIRDTNLLLAFEVNFGRFKNSTKFLQVCSSLKRCVVFYCVKQLMLFLITAGEDRRTRLLKATSCNVAAQIAVLAVVSPPIPEIRENRQLNVILPHVTCNTEGFSSSATRLHVTRHWCLGDLWKHAWHRWLPCWHHQSEVL